MVIKKKSIEDLKDQAQGFLNYADYRYIISNEQRDKMFDLLGISESDKKGFFDRLFKNNDKIILSKNKIGRKLTKGSLFKKGVLDKDDFKRLWNQYSKYLKAKKIVEKYVSLPETSNHNLICMLYYNLNNFSFLKNFEIMMKSGIQKSDVWLDAVSNGNYRFGRMYHLLDDAIPENLKIFLEKYSNEDFDNIFANEIGNFLEHMNSVTLNFLLQKFPEITIEQLLKFETTQSYNRHNNVFDFYPNITLNELLWLDRRFGFENILKCSCEHDLLKLICRNRKLCVENYTIIFKHYNSLLIDKMGLGYLHSQLECFINDTFDVKSVEELFKRYPDILPDNLSIIGSIPRENLNIIFSRFSNLIPIDDLVSCAVALKNANPKNLNYIFSEYSSEIILSDLNNFENSIGDDNFCKILELIKKNFKNKFPYNDLKLIGNLFNNYFYLNLRLLLHIYQKDGCDFDMIKSLSNVLSDSVPLNFCIAYDNYSINDLFKLSDVLSLESKKFSLIFGKFGNITVEEWNSLLPILSVVNEDNFEIFMKHFGKNFGDLEEFSDDLDDVKDILTSVDSSNLESLLSLFDPSLNDLKQHSNVFIFCGSLPKDIVFKESNKAGYLDYIDRVLDLGVPDDIQGKIISQILNLSFGSIDNYLKELKYYCITNKYPFELFFQCFDGNCLNARALKLYDEGFDLPILLNDVGKRDNAWLLNNSIRMTYPNFDVNFNGEEADVILNFVDSVGGINKGYTILILTMEKMFRDGVDSRNFANILCKKLKNYKKVLDMYPENKIPEGLKISVGFEFEIIELYAGWYYETTGNHYYETVDRIVKLSKGGAGNDGVFEFATKPSTNPLVALLEVYLLQELNLIDINDMQKLSSDYYGVNYKSRNGTGYHLNIGSDSNIYNVKNINFIQNLCTLLPRSGISNGGSVDVINYYSDVRRRVSVYDVFPHSDNNKNCDSDVYVELRTYSVDDVELFEKNVLFNTYAFMGSQAQNLVSNISNKTIYDLANHGSVNNQSDLLKFLENNKLFKGSCDFKSKKIATEFIYMQLCVLRAIDDYNNNFIDNELFGIDLTKNLSESRKNFFFDLLLYDNRETIGFDDQGLSSMVIKRYTNLLDNFDSAKYFTKCEPFSDKETQKILTDFGNNIDEKWIGYVTTRLNKQLLWQLLINGNNDTQDLQDKINNKVSNIDRIKSYLSQKIPGKKIDRQFLQKYFQNNMSMDGFNPYGELNLKFMNEVICLNNFFLKEDDTNANGVLQWTIFDGNEEPDISKLSIFETGYMRKGYNYYQGGSENMILHKVQKIALDYMENVKNILNSDALPSENSNFGYMNAA